MKTSEDLVMIEILFTPESTLPCLLKIDEDENNLQNLASTGYVLILYLVHTSCNKI